MEPGDVSPEHEDFVGLERTYSLRSDPLLFQMPLARELICFASPFDGQFLRCFYGH